MKRALIAGVLLLPAPAEAAPVHDVGGATAYCQSGRMADGTYTRVGSVAMNSVRLGTRIRVVGRQAGPGGRRKFTVRDRIGYGSLLDFYMPSCSAAVAWGRRHVRYRVGW